MVRREKKLISLPSAKKHSAKKRVCRVPKETLGKEGGSLSAKKNTRQRRWFAECQKNTRQRRGFAECQKKTLGCTCKLGSFYLISEIICRAGQVTRRC